MNRAQCPDCGLFHRYQATPIEDDRMTLRELAWLLVSGLGLWGIVFVALFLWLAIGTGR